MDDKKPDQITNEFVAGQNSVIITMLAGLQSDNKANHRENTSKIDTIAANTHSMRSEVDKHHGRITILENYKTQEVEPLVNAHKKRKWMWLGGTGVLGAVSSPAWLPKVIATLHAVWP